MATLQFGPLNRRQTFEAALAVLVLLLTAAWLTEPAVVFDNAPAVVGYLWLPAILLAPGALALSILAGGLAHGLRVGSGLVGEGKRSRPGDTAPIRILASGVFGAFAVVTLWWVAGSVGVLFFAERGGVLLAPFVALAVGSALGGLVLIRTAVEWLFLEGPADRVRGSAVE